ncbi:MAG: thioesterase [Solirubrobacterales bacterium]|nr:thioesterase [Solirubrobacterales bacterium]
MDVDERGVAHPHSLGRWLQEVAVADSLDAGLTRETAWIIRRTRIESERLPRFDEMLELRTWCSGMAKSAAERTIEIRGDKGAKLDATAIWVHLDPVLRRPARLPEEFHAVYGASAAGNRARSSLRHDARPPEDAEVHEWRFVRADIDVVGHVNNTMYWRAAEQLLDLDALADSPGSLEAEYRGGIGAGLAVVHRSEGRLWFCDTSGEVAATIAAETTAPA